MLSPKLKQLLPSKCDFLATVSAGNTCATKLASIIKECYSHCDPFLVNMPGLTPTPQTVFFTVFLRDIILDSFLPLLSS